LTRTAAVFSILCLSFFWGCPMENSFIFFPAREIQRTPEEAGLLYEDVSFSTEKGIRLNGWYIPSPEAEITLLWFHGNAGNISHRVENLRLVHDRLKTNIFIFDYRGYGRSEGSISEEGTYEDARAALQYLRNKKSVDSKRLVLFGRSLGAAVATHLAIQEDALALILETPFVSIEAMARVVLPFLPIGALLKTKYDVLEMIPRAKPPVLVLHGDRDDVVPYDQGRRVFEAARAPKEFYTIRGASHNDTYVAGGEAYFAFLKDYIDRKAAGGGLDLRTHRG